MEDRREEKKGEGGREERRGKGRGRREERREIYGVE